MATLTSLLSWLAGIAFGILIFFIPKFVKSVCEHLHNMHNIRKVEQSPEHQRYCEITAEQQRAIAKYHTVNSYIARMAQAKTREELAEVKAEADAFLNGYYRHTTA